MEIDFADSAERYRGELRVHGGRIAEITAFYESALFPSFDLPSTLDR